MNDPLVVFCNTLFLKIQFFFKFLVRAHHILRNKNRTVAEDLGLRGCGDRANPETLSHSHLENV